MLIIIWRRYRWHSVSYVSSAIQRNYAWTVKFFFFLFMPQFGEERLGIAVTLIIAAICYFINKPYPHDYNADGKLTADPAVMVYPFLPRLRYVLRSSTRMGYRETG